MSLFQVIFRSTTEISRKRCDDKVNALVHIDNSEAKLKESSIESESLGESFMISSSEAPICNPSLDITSTRNFQHESARSPKNNMETKSLQQLIAVNHSNEALYVPENSLSSPPIQKPALNLKRRSEDSAALCITRQKGKLIRLSGKNVPHKAELPNVELLDCDTRKYVFTSSLELISTSDAFANIDLHSLDHKNISGNEMFCELNSADLLSPTGKTDIVFTCNVCEELFNTEREKRNHEKTHLECKLCKRTMSTWKEYVKHLHANCYVHIVQDRPIVKLTRIDSEDIIEKYPE